MLLGGLDLVGKESTLHDEANHEGQKLPLNRLDLAIHDTAGEILKLPVQAANGDHVDDEEEEAEGEVDPEDSVSTHIVRCVEDVKE